jgi:hypothetical protein
VGFIIGFFVSFLLWAAISTCGYIHLDREKNFDQQDFYEANWRQKQEISRLWKQRNLAWRELNSIKDRQQEGGFK